VFLMKTLFISEAGPDTHILIIVNNSLSSVGKHGRIGYLCTSNYFNWIFSSKIKHNISETSLHTYQLPINLFIPATPRYHTRKHPTETTGEGLNLGKKEEKRAGCHSCEAVHVPSLSRTTWTSCTGKWERQSDSSHYTIRSITQPFRLFRDATLFSFLVSSPWMRFHSMRIED
jgi:hypothetical protein